MTDVLICFQKERRTHAERLAATLEAYGYETGWDREPLVSAGPPERNETRPERSQLVIVLWCSASVRSVPVCSEAIHARNSARLVEVYLEWVEPPPGFEPAQGLALVNWRGEPEAESVDSLLATIAEQLGSRRRSPNLIRSLRRAPALAPVEPLQMNADEHTAPKAAADRITEPRPALRSAARWALIDKSLTVRDYQDFIEAFPSAPEAPTAERRIRQLQDWAGVDHTSPNDISEFLADPVKGADLFATLGRHIRSTLRRSGIASLTLALELADDEKARSEAEARALEQLEARLGREGKRAVLAALAGNPAAERIFPLRLPGLAGWPRPRMAVIPPGRFMMGAPPSEADAAESELPQHEVVINYAFALGQHPVTFAEWDAARESGAPLPNLGDNGWGRNRRPVINVSWEGASAYIEWLNERFSLSGKYDAFRLPSEAEWEYACRAGTATAFHFGETITSKQANYNGHLTYGAGPKGAYPEKTVPVGSYPANDFGLHDMHGNVWEWCADSWHYNYSGAPKEGSVWEGDHSPRVLRGGSWVNNPVNLRSAARTRVITSSQGIINGFRLARTI
jgi:formylglycine-generating enzyme required for sulfatase activity